VNNFGTDRDISKIQTDLNSANKRLSFEIMFIESKVLIQKFKNPKLKTPNISVMSQNLKNEKR
jgi:hypothetical protein